MILPGAGRGTGGAGSRHGRRPDTYLAPHLRREMSLPEVMLWERLRNAKAGVKIRRQHPMGPYVVDFYCREALLVIEVDGATHENGQPVIRDAARDAFLIENGCRILRLPAADILRDPDGAAASVAAAASPLHHAGGVPSGDGEDQE